MQHQIDFGEYRTTTYSSLGQLNSTALPNTHHHRACTIGLWDFLQVIFTLNKKTGGSPLSWRLRASSRPGTEFDTPGINTSIDPFRTNITISHSASWRENKVKTLVQIRYRYKLLFCGDLNETDMHIFWDCSLNNILWNIEISYNKQNIVFYCIS